LTLKTLYATTQVQVVATFHAQLKIRPPKKMQLTERWEYLQQRPSYVPASKVQSPAIPHFAVVADTVNAPVVLQAPVICQLCGVGCLTRQTLWKHCELHHHSWCEYRKRLIFEVQQRHAVPLRPVEKRRLAGNYMQDLLYSRPGRGTVNPSECTMRQVVACAVCAFKDWIDDYYPCYLWKETPTVLQSTEKPDEEEEEGDCEVEAQDVEDKSRRQRVTLGHGPQLKDADGYCYLGPADKIQKLLDVNKYVPIVPGAPLEELHASSVEHPRTRTCAGCSTQNECRCCRTPSTAAWQVPLRSTRWKKRKTHAVLQSSCQRTAAWNRETPEPDRHAPA